MNAALKILDTFFGKINSGIIHLGDFIDLILSRPEWVFFSIMFSVVFIVGTCELLILRCSQTVPVEKVSPHKLSRTGFKVNQFKGGGL